MLVDVEAVLRFFDERPLGSPGHATAIVAVAGEDLGVGLLCHYLNARQLRAEALQGPCTTGKKVGSRLDRWLWVSGPGSKTLCQVEVKNWSAHAIGIPPHPLCCRRTSLTRRDASSEGSNDMAAPVVPDTVSVCNRGDR